MTAGPAQAPWRCTTRCCMISSPRSRSIWNRSDSVLVTTLMDNLTDNFMPDQGPARRVGLGSGPRRPAAVMADGQVPDALIAEHGFSMRVTVTKAGREHRSRSMRAPALMR